MKMYWRNGMMDRVPMTGDSTNIMPYVILMVVAVVVIAGFIIYKKKKKK